MISVADFGVDGYRYHFLADVPFGPDNDFSYEGMTGAALHADLANNLGNLLFTASRPWSASSAGESVPRPGPTVPLAHVAVLAFDHTGRSVGARAAI